MFKSILEKLAGKLVDQVVDIHNFEIRQPYKQAVVGTAKNSYQKLKQNPVYKNIHDQTTNIIENEPTIAAFKKVFGKKVKPLSVEDLADKTQAFDFYQVLGVAKNADAEAIKKAWKTAAIKYHPDKNQGNVDNTIALSRINDAYNVLSDEKKRALYDEFGEESLKYGFNAEATRQARNFQY